MFTIDGSAGEGGGQILRSSLALSLITGEPVKVGAIRKGRARPGLMRQHLAAVKAAAEIGQGEVSGAELGSKEIVFRPGQVRPGDYTFRIGTAGSTTLVLQTVLPALLRASGPSSITLEGGTDNPMAPPFDFLAQAYLPLVRRMGPAVSIALEARGFFPAGGGRFRVDITPGAQLARLDLLERGEVLRKRVTAIVANLPASVAMREIAAASALLGWDRSCFAPQVIKGAPGPGNVVSIAVESEQVTEVFTGFGEKSVRAEIVAERVAREAQAYLDAGVPVGEHLADQLLLLMALAGGGSFRTVEPSSHSTTHIALLKQILGTKIHSEREGDKVWRVEVCA